MKAFLLAAGLGTRLRPLTNEIPKCLVPIDGRPLLDYWFRLFEKHGVTEVLINLHHLAEQVTGFVANSRYSISIEAFHEETLLGSAGTLLANKSWVVGKEKFLVAYADNFTNANLGAMMRFHNDHTAMLTMGLFRTERPNECGIAVLDDEKTVVEFVEKPAVSKSDLANAGIYIASPEIFDYFEDSYPQDFGFDVLPKLVGKMKGFFLDAYLLDIGNMERYRQAQEDVTQLCF